MQDRAFTYFRMALEKNLHQHSPHREANNDRQRYDGDHLKMKKVAKLFLQESSAFI